jgi:hypothetical protein
LTLSWGVQVPLAKGSERAMRAAAYGAGFKKRPIEWVIHNRYSSFGYLLALTKEGAWRYDLNGNPVEPVSPEAQHAAKMSLEAKRHKIEAQRDISDMSQ